MELFSLVSNQSIFLRTTSCGFYFILISKWHRRRAKWLRRAIEYLLINENDPVLLRNLHVTKNRLSFACSQTLFASENKFNSMGNVISTEKGGDARRLVQVRYRHCQYHFHLLLRCFDQDRRHESCCVT